MTAATTVAFVQGLYAAFGRGDVAAVQAACAPDVGGARVGKPWASPRFGGRNGRAGVGEFFRLLAENEEFTSFEPLSSHAAGDKVFVLGRLCLLFKSNDRAVNTDWIHIFTVRNGQV